MDYTITLTQDQLWDVTAALNDASDRAARTAEMLEARGEDASFIRDAQAAVHATRDAISRQVTK